MKTRLLVTLMVLLAPPILTWAVGPEKMTKPLDGFSSSPTSEPAKDDESKMNREPSAQNSESKESSDRPSEQPWSKQMRNSAHFSDRF